MNRRTTTRRYYRQYSIIINRLQSESYSIKISKCGELIESFRCKDDTIGTRAALDYIDNLYKGIKTEVREKILSDTYRIAFEADNNPLTTSSSEFLLKAAAGEIDLNYLAKIEIASRGIGKQGKWVGFDEAKEEWGV